MNENYTSYNDTEKSGNDTMKEQVLEMLMKTTMTTGMWKQLLRKLVDEQPAVLPWLHHNLCEQASQQAANAPAATTMMGIEGQSAVAQNSDDPLHEELMARLDTIDEDSLLSCQSNALWVFRLMLQMGNLERALTAAEMDKSVFLRNITEALGYDESERFRIYNYLRRYDR